MNLFDEFPSLSDDKIIIGKMSENDVGSLEEITENANVYRYIPPFFYRKSRGNLLAAIRNCGERDFIKKKHIIAGIYLKKRPDKLVGIAEMFDYRKRTNDITIGYKINESYWNMGIAKAAISLMREYLTEGCAISAINAYVVPENIYSAKALVSNGFIKMTGTVEQKNWGKEASVFTDRYVYIRR